jgi:hypothetical protein
MVQDRAAVEEFTVAESIACTEEDGRPGESTQSM